MKSYEYKEYSDVFILLIIVSVIFVGDHLCIFKKLYVYIANVSY